MAGERINKGVTSVALRDIRTIFSAVIIGVYLLLYATVPSFAQDYLIGSQDILKIAVFEYPDLTTEVRVSEDGKITFPLLGEIEAKNLSTRQVEKVIAEKLATSKIVKDPQVSVFVQQYRGRKVTVIGEVVKPGQYEIVGPTSILDTISLAQGMSQNAGFLLTVFRKEPDTNGSDVTKKIMIDVDRLLNGGDLSQDIQLQNGDVIYVPKAIFYIYGEVNRPGAYRLDKGLTVKRAIALAGGLTPKGCDWRIDVTRKEGETEATSSATIDDALKFDDVVRIKESIF